MNRVFVLLVSLVSVSLFFFASSSAMAEDDDFDRSGMYVGGFVAASFSLFSDDSATEASPGVSLRVGWRENDSLLPWPMALVVGPWGVDVPWALELVVEYVDDLGEVDARIITGGASVKVFPPYKPFRFMDGRIQSYTSTGIFGLGDNGASHTIDNRDCDEPGCPPKRASDWAFRWAAGTEFYATNHIAIALEGSYTYGLGEVNPIRYATITLGLIHRF